MCRWREHSRRRPRTHSGQPQSGSQGLELEAITAALTTGMILLGIQSFYQLVAKGALLVLAVAIQQDRLSRTGVQTGTALT